MTTDPPRRSAVFPALLIALVLLIVAATLTLVMYLLFSRLPGELDVATARRHLIVLQSEILSDPRFADVLVDLFVTDGLNIVVQGEVPDEETAQWLRDRIDASHPPVPIIFQLAILPAPPPATAPATAPSSIGP